MSNIARRDVPGWGADLAEQRRPGVPRRPEPRRRQGAHWDSPERQEGSPTSLLTALRSEPTPVFGTAVPLRGLSGRIRRLAYAIPDDRVSHWMTLMFADRVDVAESAAGEALSSPVGLFFIAATAAGLAAYWLSSRETEA